MSDNLPGLIDQDAPIFVISIAAHLSGMHPQTLRQYDRLGLVVPHRTRGKGRRYSPNDVAKLRLVQQLSQEEGINLPGIRRILQLEDQVRMLTEKLGLLSDVMSAMQMSHPRLFTADRSGRVDFGRTRRPRGELTR